MFPNDELMDDVFCIPSGIIGGIAFVIYWIAESFNADRLQGEFLLLVFLIAWIVHCGHVYLNNEKNIVLTILMSPLACLWMILSSLFMIVIAIIYPFVSLYSAIQEKRKTRSIKESKPPQKVERQPHPKDDGGNTESEINNRYRNRSVNPKNTGFIICPFCKTYLQLPANSEGKNAQCQQCKNKFTIPDKFPHPLVKAKRTNKIRYP